MSVSSLRSPGTEAPPERISVLVVDDHPVLRFGVAALLDRECDFDVIGTAKNCAEAVRMTDEHAPDIVLLDLEMEDAEGAEAPFRLRDHEAAKVVQAMKAGCDVVLVDRYVHSLATYQGLFLGGSDSSTFSQAALSLLGHVRQSWRVCFLRWPDIVFLLDAPIRVISERFDTREGRQLSHIEVRRIEDLQDGYRSIAEADSAVVTVDSARELADVTAEIKSSILVKLGKGHG